MGTEKWIFIDGYVDQLDKWENFAGTSEGKEAAEKTLVQMKLAWPKVTKWRMSE